jgi:hypothetical protein
MFVKDLKFGNGIAFFRETQIYLFPANYVMACFKLGCDNFEPGVWKRHLRDFTFDDSYILYNKFKDLSRRQIFDCFLDYIKYFGFGEVKLAYCNDKKILFTLVNDSYGGYYQKLYDEVPKVLPEEIIAGFLENYFSLVYGKTLICNIVKVSRSYNFELEITGEDFNLKSEKTYPNFEVGNVSLSLKKLLINKAVKFEKGFLFVGGNKAFDIPYFFLLNLIKSFSYNKSLIDKFNSLGYAQGRAANSLHKYLGMADGEEVFNRVMGMYDLSGVGVIKYNCGKYSDVELCNNILFYLSFYDNNILKTFNNHIFYMYKGNYDFSFNIKTKFKFSLINKVELLFLEDEIKLDEFSFIIYEYLTTKVLYTEKK